jgi:hypothetical protein
LLQLCGLEAENRRKAGLSLESELAFDLAKLVGFRLFGWVWPFWPRKRTPVAQFAARNTAPAGRIAPVAVVCASLDGLLLLSRP